MLGALLLFAVCCLSAPIGHAAETTTGALSLSVDLFEEGQWQPCRAESARILLSSPTNDVARLLHATSALRLNKDASSELLALIESPATSATVKGMALYELGQHAWKKEQYESAFSYFKTLFLASPTKSLFLRAGCSADILSTRYSKQLAAAPSLSAQLATCRELWTPQLRQECDIQPRQAGPSWTVKPGQWAIAFYRSQIGPAIGSRCSLYPSCSTYGLQALQKHGLLGFSMIADRGFREPDIVANKKFPILVGERRLYRDPLSAHDYWMDE